MDKLLLTSLFLWIVLTIYSYSQVDLNLTLSSHSVYQTFQNLMTTIGYYQRPISAAIFLILILSLTVCYVRLIYKLQRSTQTRTRSLLRFIVLIYIVSIFAYPAFSYDIYNYMFYGRIVVHHHLSPYYFRALDFPDDSWTRFMRWTHNYYPYGPLWLWLLLMPSVLGQGKFVLTLLLFKVFFLLGALGNVKLVRLLGEKANMQNLDSVTAFFALNPLVIIESIVSPHNDVYLLFFMLLSLWLFMSSKKILSFLCLLGSIGIKFLTASVLPIYLLPILQKKKLSSWQILALTLLLYIIVLLPLIYLREPYAWYFIPVLALVSFFIHKPILFWMSIGLTLGTLLRYVPYLYFGHWNAPVPTLKLWITVCSIVIGVIIGGLSQSRNTN